MIGCRSVDGQRAFAGELEQVVRPACFWAGTGQTFAAERLHADHRSDLVAVDVAIADPDVAHDVLHRGIDARVDAQRQAVAGGIDLRQHLVQVAGLVADDMEDRTEYFLRKLRC